MVRPYFSRPVVPVRACLLAVLLAVLVSGCGGDVQSNSLTTLVGVPIVDPDRAFIVRSSTYSPDVTVLCFGEHAILSSDRGVSVGLLPGLCLDNAR